MVEWLSHGPGMDMDGSLGPLTVCCGEAGVKGKHMMVELPSEHEAALSQFHQVDSCHLKDPAKFTLQLLSVFFSDEEFGRPNCTKAEGREILNPQVLTAIKRKCSIQD